MARDMKGFARCSFAAVTCIMTSLSGFSAHAQSPSTPPPQPASQSSSFAPADLPSGPILHWSVPPFAPAFITDSPELSGYAADTQNWFVDRLPQYRHEILQVPLARLLAEMKSGEGELRCSTTLIPTEERRQYIAFADTILLHLPISVVIRVQDKQRFSPYLDDKGHIDLSRLLADQNMITAVRIGRAYGTQVDKYLSAYREDPHVMHVADDTKFLRMLELERIDWSLYFPSEAEFYRRRHTPDLDIMAIPINGNTTLLEATIGCADTPAGKKAIAEINDIIEKNPNMPWTDFYSDWLSPQDREWFKAARDQFINSDQFETRLQYSPHSAK